MSEATRAHIYRVVATAIPLLLLFGGNQLIFQNLALS